MPIGTNNGNDKNLDLPSLLYPNPRIDVPGGFA
jgi:hypothetical protein